MACNCKKLTEQFDEGAVDLFEDRGDFDVDALQEGESQARPAAP
jgi:hypothetical protein